MYKLETICKLTKKTLLNAQIGNSFKSLIVNRKMNKQGAPSRADIDDSLMRKLTMRQCNVFPRVKYTKRRLTRLQRGRLDQAKSGKSGAFAHFKF